MGLLTLNENLKHISFMDAQYSQEFVFMSAIASLLEVCPKNSHLVHFYFSSLRSVFNRPKLSFGIVQALVMLSLAVDRVFLFLVGISLHLLDVVL